MLMRWNLFKWWYNRIQYVGYLIHDSTSRTLGFKETVVGYSGMSQCRLTCEEFKSSIKKGGSEKEEALTHNLKTVTWQVVKTRIGRNSPNKIGSSTNSMDVARKLPYPKNLCEFAIFPQEIINEFIEFPKSPDFALHLWISWKYGQFYSVKYMLWTTFFPTFFLDCFRPPGWAPSPRTRSSGPRRAVSCCRTRGSTVRWGRSARRR